MRVTLILGLLLVLSSLTIISATNSSATDPEDAAWYVYKSGSTYYARNVTTDSVWTSGTNAATVINAALGALTIGRTWKETVLVDCDIVLSADIEMTDYSKLEFTGTATLSANSGMVGASYKSHVEIMGGVWNSGSYNRANGVYFDHCSDVYVHDIEAITVGICLSRCTDSRVMSNYCHGVTYELKQGIHTYNDCSDIEIGWNTVSNNNKGGGIYIFQRNDGSSHTTTDVWVHNNTVTSVYTDGIGLYPEGSINHCEYCLVENNTITDAATSGDHTMMSVGWGGGSGLHSTENCDHNIIRNNVVQASGSYAVGGYIYVRGDWNLVANNTVNNAQKPAMSLLHANNNTFENNIVNGTSLSWADALTIYGSSDNTIRWNFYSNPGNNCVYISTSGYAIPSSRNTIQGNTLNGPGAHWVSISGSTCRGNKILGNILTNPGGFHDAGTRTIFSNNTEYEGDPTYIGSISADVVSGGYPLSVQFAVHISGDTGPYTYYWTFGDGASSSMEDPIHTYGSVGTYTVRLTVDGTSAPNTLTVYVAEPDDDDGGEEYDGGDDDSDGNRANDGGRSSGGGGRVIHRSTSSSKLKWVGIAAAGILGTAAAFAFLGPKPKAKGRSKGRRRR